MAQAKFRGRFLWQELMTEDPAAATTFYSKLLGWSAKESGGEPAYTEFHAGERGVAGMMKMPEAATKLGAKPMWTPYIGVENVDDAVEDIEELGGKVHRPASDIPNVGRFAVVSDPQGAAFAVFKPSGPAMPPVNAGVPQVGEFSWLELATTELEEAFEFYSKLFGWEVLGRHEMGPAGTYLVFGSEGIQRGGIFKAGPERGPTPNWLPYATVADVDRSAKEIPGFGGRVLAGPMDVPDNGRIVHLSDPGGVLFALYTLVAPKKKDAAAKPAGPAKAAPAAPKPAKSAAPKPAAKSVPKPAAVAGDGLPVMAAEEAPSVPPAAKKSLTPKKLPAKAATPVTSAPAAKKPAATKSVAKKAKKKAAAKKKRAATKTSARKTVSRRGASPAVAKRAAKSSAKTGKKSGKKDKKKDKTKGKKKPKKDKRKKDKSRRKK